jgi:D-alanyl-D-alanine carboxypeptidase
MRRPRAACAALLLVAVGLAACTDDAAFDARPNGPTSGDTSADGDGGASSDRADRTGVVVSDDPRAEEILGIVDAAIRELALRTVVFGVWVGDEEVVRGALDSPSSRPPTAVDARFRVGQPMEAMLGTILLQLADEGAIDLDDPVDSYVPDLVDADRITPRMLANSTGGMPDYVRDEAFQDRVLGDPFEGTSFDELLSYAQRTAPLFEPGTSWAYSHTEMAVLVEVLEGASGESLEELMASRIFEPLGMTSSSAHHDSSITAPILHAYTDARGVYEESTFWDPTWGLNGSMNSSTADLARWLQALNAGSLLDDDDAEELLSPVTAGLGTMTEDRYFSYGSLVSEGWILGNPNLNGYQGFTAQQRDPSVTIVVWSTVAPGRTDESNASQEIARRIAAVVSDDPFTA